MARLLRNVPILVLWFWYFGQEKSWGDPVTIFTGAIVIGLSFFIPIAKKTLIIFLFIQVILLGYLTFFATGGIWILILTNWLYVVEAMLMERERDFKIFAVLSVILQSFALFLNGQLTWLAWGFMLTFYFMAILGNHAINERNEIQEMYEALTGEYRRMKRLARLAEEEARNEERTKIARDIHDSVGHKLTALLMQLEIFAMNYGYEKIAPHKKLASDSLEETRNAVKALKAKEIEGISTILQLIKKLESESFLEVHLTTKQGILSTKLTNEESVVLHRVIQEGLTNAMRHAHVREVYVELGRSAIGHIEFLIKNRIPKKMPFTEGFGIKNLRERVEQLGGKLFAYQTETHFILKGHFPAKEG